jgi:hypothetical protein
MVSSKSNENNGPSTKKICQLSLFCEGFRPENTRNSHSSPVSVGRYILDRLVVSSRLGINEHLHIPWYHPEKSPWWNTAFITSASWLKKSRLRDWLIRAAIETELNPYSMNRENM